MQKQIGFVFGCLVTLSAFAFSPTFPIEVKSAKRDKAGMTLQMQTGVLQLQVCGDRTIHVHFSSAGDLQKVPSGFAVQKQPAPGAFETTDTADTVTLKAAQCSVISCLL